MRIKLVLILTQFINRLRRPPQFLWLSKTKFFIYFGKQDPLSISKEISYQIIWWLINPFFLIKNFKKFKIPFKLIFLACYLNNFELEESPGGLIMGLQLGRFCLKKFL